MAKINKLVLHTDGGSRGNPGPASAAAVLTDPDSGAEIFAGGFYLGRTTNNVAEYQGLVKGLEKAVELGVIAIDVFTDSELMTRQVMGVYKVKNAGLKPLYQQVMDLADEFDSFNITHVRRMHNKRADELVNISLDAGRDVIENGCGFAASGAATVSDEDTASASASAPEAEFAAASVRLTARCIGGCNCNCPGDMQESVVVDLPGVSDSGQCIFAITGIVNAFLSAGGGDSFVATCAAPGCGAKFQVAVNRV